MEWTLKEVIALFQDIPSIRNFAGGYPIREGPTIG